MTDTSIVYTFIMGNGTTRTDTITKAKNDASADDIMAFGQLLLSAVGGSDLKEAKRRRVITETVTLGD